MSTRTAIREATAVTIHATRARLTVLSSASTGLLSPSVRTAAAVATPAPPPRILANCGNTGATRGFSPVTWQEWARARFREGSRCPQTVLASVFPTKVEGGASDQI